MYYLQATVYENHGYYDTHCYLWSREQNLPDLLLADGFLPVPPRPAFMSEHETILSAILAVMSVLQDKVGVSEPGESLF